MAKTVVGLFDTNQEAQAVVQDLVNDGFARNNISIVANDPNGEHMQHNSKATASAAGGEGIHQGDTGEHAANTAGAAAGGAITGGLVGGGIGLVLGLLGAVAVPVIGPIIAAGPIAAALTGAGIGAVAGGLLGALTHAGVPEEDAHYYAEGVQRGGTLIMINAPDDRAQRAYEIIEDHGAVDIEERAAQYKQAGWTGFNPNAQPVVANAKQVVETTTTTTAAAPVSQPRPVVQQPQPQPRPVQQAQARQLQGEEVLPVVQEELAVGKRAVRRGGARIFTRLTEQPVEEQVTLHDEKVTIDRQAVSRPVSQADLVAFKDGVIEVTATGEEAVVSKQARVIEEVRVGKEVSERAETVREQVRRTDVEVEQIPAGQATTTATTVTGTTTTGGFTSYNQDFRTHFKSLNATGSTYEQFAPVYQYGYNLADDQAYKGRDWSAIQGDVQKQWEAKNPGTWAQFKDSIHYAWDKARGATR